MRRHAISAIFALSLIGLFGAMVIPREIGTTSGNQASAATPASKSPYICRVTLPNDNMPPNYDLPPFPAGHYGNGKLGANLSRDGIILFTPDQVGTNGEMEAKWGWWRGIKGQLTITGKRLDAAAPPLRANIPAGYGDHGFQVSGIIFPTEGCWQVTGQVGNTSLTFVTLVLRSPTLAEPATPSAR